MCLTGKPTESLLQQARVVQEKTNSPTSRGLTKLSTAFDELHGSMIKKAAGR